MASSHRRSTTGWACLTTLSIAVIVAFASFASIAAAAQSSRAVARSSRAIPASLARAARLSTSADKALVASAKALKHCISKHRSHPSKCRAAKASVQRSGVQLAAARRGLAQVAHRTAHSGSSVDSVQQAPSLSVAGDTLSWTHVAGVPSYVLVRTVAGQPAQYSVVNGTSTTPPPVPGVTAGYSVRTAVNGSEWSATQAISYPSGTSVPDTQAAPVIAVSGGNITWSAVGGVSTYILASTAPGKATQYTVVSGDSIAPEPAPGQTLQFSIRTAVDGSAWSAQVSITFPGTTGAGGGEAPVTFSEPFVKGINANIAGWGSQAPQVVSEMNTLGVNWEREDLSWSEAEPQQGVFDWSSFESVLATARANGITILPIVGYAPSWTSPDNATAYAEFVGAAVARFGPGTEANLQWWELWNEPYFAYAWSNKTPEPEAYARDVVAAAQAARSTAPSVKLLISADYVVSPQAGGSTPYETSWIDDMFAAEPELGKWINAVSAHPYGDDPALALAEAGGYKDAEGNWAFQRIDTIRAKFLAHGVNVPFWITEAGWSTYESNEAVQAHNYADLITQVKARPWIRALFPFCLREFSANATNNQPGFGLLKYGSWQPKEAFTTLQAGFKTLS